MKHLVLITVLLVLPAVSGAASYSWTDPSGTMHFTDDLGSVPSKYRAKALRQAAGEEAIPATQSVKVKNEAKPSAAPGAPAGSVSQTGSAQGAATPSTRFGDRTAAEWQQQFQTLRAQLKTIEQEMEQLKQDGGDGKRMLGREKIAELNARSRHLNQEYEKNRLQLNQLVEQANKVGLPPEYGQ
ncbi:MAG: DUF4124 domain-containing protein [Geobacteraceae bacterium]|nr:DUF4124 domain-containing protein [Geobacteraceae bacterium]